jgi:ABC-2 type transport system permease protein
VAYRTDLLFQGLMTAMGMAAGGAALGIVFSHVRTLAGWNLAEAIVLLGTFTAVSGLLETFVEPNLSFFSSKLLSGELDDALLQPVSSLFLVSLGSAQPWALSQVILGLGVMGAGLERMGGSLTVGGLLAGLILLPAGIVTLWSYRVLLASFAFWAPGLDPTVLFSAFWQMGRYPVTIYRGPVRWALTYAVPVGFVTTVPVRVLTHGPDSGMLLSSLLALIGSLVAVHVVWHAGLRRYTSATS